MKKLALCLVLVSLFLIAGCEKKGTYKEGTYFGSTQFVSYGAKYVTTAVVYVNENGNIKSVFIDTTYTKDAVSTTKKVLGDAYGMKASSLIKKEWFEQVNTLEAKIVKEQGLDWLEFKDAAKTETESVSGVTITVDTYYAAVKAALDQAK